MSIIHSAGPADNQARTTGEAILGANMFKDLFAGIRDIVGGRSATYEKELRKARDLAIGELSQNAANLGANAVVGIDLDYETVGGQGSMLMLTVSGTAVVARPFRHAPPGVDVADG